MTHHTFAKEDKKAAIGILNQILELELAGVVRYTHYALMVYGYSRIPIVGWLNAQADEGLLHARQAGEIITGLGGQPSLGIGPLLDGHQYDIGAILRGSLQHEQAALDAYYRLLDCVRDKDVRLEEYARMMIGQEQAHQEEVEKMLHAPGQAPALDEPPTLLVSFSTNPSVFDRRVFLR